MPGHLGTRRDRQKLHAGRHPVRLDREVPVRCLYPVRVGQFVHRIGEALSAIMTAQMLDYGIGKDQVITAPSDVGG